MSLPPGFLDELRGRLSLSQVVGRKVMWDQRKSNQGRGDMWAPCPFHQEKTASFHVDDRKGYYYCFGCHAKGDAISFVKETENVSFIEAIEILAREAGMPMPARDPGAQQKADRRGVLTEVMEQALRYFRMQLKTSAGSEARSYLDRRGLTDAAQERWEIGFAPAGWEGLREAMTARGVPVEDLLACGLVKSSDKGRAPYDVFRNRIMFPIRDARGRCIAFGGRAMDPSDNAKYLNSPETELFDKSRNLYNLQRAREAAGKGQRLIVAEGYMDVIALGEAGFTAAVAPLGTAVTEPQLQMMWRVSPEPVIALDGDTAGLRAAHRVIDLALPLLEAGKALRFALMPQGQDPDDLIRAGGARAMQAVLDQAQPMVNLLWTRETEGQTFDSPERRAALDKVLRERLRSIRDPSIRAHYVEAIKELRWQLFGQSRRGGKPGEGPARGRWVPRGTPLPATPGAKSSLLASPGEIGEDRLRVAVILAVLAATPAVLPEFEAQLERLDCDDPDLDALREALMSLPAGADARAHVAQRCGAGALETLLAMPHLRICPALRRPGDAEQARMTLAEELAKLTALRGLDAEVAEAEEELGGLPDEAVTWRLRQAAEARNRALRSQQEDRAVYEAGPNGLLIDREERSAFDALLERIDFSRPRR